MFLLNWIQISFLRANYIKNSCHNTDIEMQDSTKKKRMTSSKIYKKCFKKGVNPAAMR